MAGPLDGIKVFDLTRVLAGPHCTQLLGDLGAEVIKVEPIGGDKTRRLKGSGAGYFSMYNRNKKSLSINLKSDAGARVAKELRGFPDEEFPGLAIRAERRVYSGLQNIILQ